MITIEQWREMLNEYPHLTYEQIIVSTYWMHWKISENKHCTDCKNKLDYKNAENIRSNRSVE